MGEDDTTAWTTKSLGFYLRRSLEALCRAPKIPINAIHGIVIFILSVGYSNLLPGVDGRTWRFNCRDSLCVPLELKPGEALGRRCPVSYFTVSLFFERMRKIFKIASESSERRRIMVAVLYLVG